MTSRGFDRFSEIAHDGQYDAPDFSVQVCLAILKICIPPTFYKEAIRGATGPVTLVSLCPCFSKFLARTTLVHPCPRPKILARMLQGVPKKWCIAISNSPVVLDVQIF